MADAKITQLTSYTKPLDTDVFPIVDVTNSLTKKITYGTLSGAYRNTSVTSQGAGFATDTYLVGSAISIPPPKAKSTYYCMLDLSKTALGTATPVIIVRFGTSGSTADTARLTFTFTAGTAAIDVGNVEIWVTFRTAGSGTTAVISGTAQFKHNLSATGFVSSTSNTLQVTSAGFDSTVANSIIGVSVNGGTSAAWTVQNVQSQFQL